MMRGVELIESAAPLIGSASRGDGKAAPFDTGYMSGAPGSISRSLVDDPDPQPPEAAALVLDLHNLDLADLAGARDVSTAVSLLVQADNVDDADLRHVLRDEVSGRPDNVRQRECLSSRQHPDIDPPVRGYLGVARGFNGIAESVRQFRQVEVHARAQRLHISACYERAVVPKHDAAEYVQARMRPHERGPALVCKGAADRGRGGRDWVAVGRNQVEVVPLARPYDPSLDTAP